MKNDAIFRFSSTDMIPRNDKYYISIDFGSVFVVSSMYAMAHV